MVCSFVSKCLTEREKSDAEFDLEKKSLELFCPGVLATVWTLLCELPMLVGMFDALRLGSLGTIPMMPS